MPQRPDIDAEAELRRIPERPAGERQGGDSLLARKARDARDHVTAADVDRADKIEYWGTRIGRMLGILLVLGLMAWMVLFLVRGG